MMRKTRLTVVATASVICAGSYWCADGKAQQPEAAETPPAPPPPRRAEPVYPHAPSPRSLPPDFDPYRPDYDRYAPPGFDEGGYSDYTYRYYEPYDPRPFEAALERAYQQGVADGRTLERLEARAQRSLAVFTRVMAEGHEAFAEGRYRVAQERFRLAATLDHGDPTSRLGLGHAFFALGRYEDAARAVRGALELEPRIAHLPMDIRGAYDDVKQFRRQMRTLREAAVQKPGDADAWFLLGYCYYFSNRPAPAAEAFAKALHAAPADGLAARLGALARASTRAQGTNPPKREPPTGDAPPSE